MKSYVITADLLIFVALQLKNPTLAKIQTCNYVTMYSKELNYMSWRQQQVACRLLANYDNAIRPMGRDKTKRNGGPVVVSTSIDINSLASFSDSLMEYTVQFRFRQEWYDPRLRFDSPEIGGFRNFDYVYFEEDQIIWIPDTFFQNEKRAHYHLVDRPNVFTKVRHDGMVMYDRRLTMVFQCHMHLLNYPHDNQTCKIDFASYAYTTTDIFYVWHPTEPIKMNESATSALPQFVLLSYNSASCTSVTATGTYGCLRVELQLRRVFSFFFLQLYIPSVMLVCVSYVSYWIDWRASPARVPLAIVTLLTMITQSHAVNSNLPPVSYTKAIDVWISGCIVFIFGSLIEYALVNYFGIRDERKRLRARRRQQRAKLKELENMERIQNIAASKLGKRPPHTAGENSVLRRRKLSMRYELEDDAEMALYDIQRGYHTSTAKERELGRYRSMLSFTEGSEELMPLYYENTRSVESFRWCHSMQVLSRAERIDLISRIIFPICFLGFNIVYWTIYAL